MPVYEETTASLAASATEDDALDKKDYKTAGVGETRILRAVGAVVLDNTPANGDIDVIVKVGTAEVGKFRAGLARTTGRELQAEDYVPINVEVPGGTAIGIRLENNDAAAAHSALLGVALE